MADTYEQDPSDRLDYTLDWSSWLTGGDTIATSTWTVPSGLTSDTPFNTGTTASTWLSGGSGGQYYGVTNHVVTAGGREGDKSFTLYVRQQSVMPTTGGITARSLITRALVLLGTIAEGDVAAPNLAEQGRAVLSELLDAWAADSLFLFSSTRFVGSFVASQADYTLGLGGDFNLPRPAFVSAVTLLDPSVSPTFEYPPLACLDDEDWSRVPQKAMTDTLPTAYTIDRTSPWMTLTFYPVPIGTSVQPVLYLPGGIATSVDSLDTTLVLPPGYLQAVRYALASELSLIPGFSPAPRGDLGKKAAMAIDRIKSNNVQVGRLAVDEALYGGGPGYNWRTGG